MRLRERLLCALIALSAVGCAAQQEPPGDEATMTLRVSAQLVLLDAQVSDKKTGALLDRLKLDDFVLREDGVVQKLTYLSQDELPLSISLLFDLTDTVQPVLKHLAEGGTEVLGHLRAEDEVAVMTFSNHLAVLQEFTQDEALLKAAIDHAAELHDRNTPTYIHESVHRATEETAKATIANSRRVELWLTDGTSNYTKGLPLLSNKHRPEVVHTKEQALNLVTHSGTAVSVLLERSGMTDAMIPFLPLMGHLGEINAYADLTGGPVMHTSARDVAARMSAMIDALRKRYTLGYRPSAEKAAGALCHVELELSPKFYREHPGLVRSRLDVRTRKVYVR